MPHILQEIQLAIKEIWHSGGYLSGKVPKFVLSTQRCHDLARPEDTDIREP